MAAWRAGGDIDEGSLQLGDEVGRGGQGSVHRVYGYGTPTVFKRYTMPGADPGALRALVDMPATLQPADCDRLMQLSSWPLARVMRGGQLAGFVMREIPSHFFGSNGGGTMKERQLQYLLYEPRPMWGNIVSGEVTIDTRIEVAAEFAKLMHLLHSQSLVIGDVSQMNILWALGDPVSIFLIDCDGIRKVGSRPVLPQADTPDWDDPELSGSGARPDLDTDRYKLALLVGRALCGLHNLRPGQPLPLLPGVPEVIAAKVRPLWDQAALPRGRRPDAVQWVLALGGRMEIVLPPLPGVRQRPQLATVEQEQRNAKRPDIRLPPRL